MGDHLPAMAIRGGWRVPCETNLTGKGTALPNIKLLRFQACHSGWARTPRREERWLIRLWQGRIMIMGKAVSIIEDGCDLHLLGGDFTDVRDLIETGADGAFAIKDMIKRNCAIGLGVWSGPGQEGVA